MEELKIFIASSNEVLNERIALQRMIGNLSNQYHEYGIRLSPAMWELESRKFNTESKQNEYNELLLTSDVAIFIFGSRVGKYTRQEFDIAVRAHKNGGKLKYIITYFKSITIDTCDLNDNLIDGLQDILDLKLYIQNELEQVYAKSFGSEDLMLSVFDEVNRIAIPLIANSTQNMINDMSLKVFVDLYTSMERAHEIKEKTNIINSGLLDLYMLSNFHILPEKKILSDEKFYEYCQKTLDSTQSGSKIKAISLMLKCEWTNTKQEQNFWGSNLDAVQRKVSLERIFIVNKNESHRLRNTPQILNHDNCKNEFLTPYIIEEEELKKLQPDLLYKAGKGFLMIIDSKFSIAILDNDSDNSNRGEPCIDKERLNELEQLFEQIKKLAKPLHIYLKTIPLSHCKKEMLSVFLTTKCNLNCDYCFTNKNISTHKCQTIDFEFVKYGIDKYFKTNYLRHIRFFGAGEPTEEFELLKKIHRHAKEKGGDYVTFEMQSNGAFNTTVARWIAKNIHIIWISCDGTPDIQDAHRPFLKDTRKTSEVIEENIHIIQSEGNGMSVVGIRSTITNDNVNRQKEMIDYFKRLDIKNIWVDPIFPSVGQEPTTSNNDFDIMHFAEEFLEACDYAEANGIFYGSILTCNFADNVTKHCRACIPMPHLTTDGFVSACDMALFGRDKNHMSPFIYGEWDAEQKQIEIDKDKINILKSRDIDNENMHHCKTCGAREHCGGYCLGEVLNETNSLFGQKEHVCEAIRFLCKNMTSSQKSYRYTHP